MEKIKEGGRRGRRVNPQPEEGVGQDKYRGNIAQQVERFPFKKARMGSNPIILRRGGVQIGQVSK